MTTGERRKGPPRTVGGGASVKGRGTAPAKRGKTQTAAGSAAKTAANSGGKTRKKR